MAEGKKSFVAYCDWINTFDELSDEEAGKLIKHLFRYVNDMNPEVPDKLTQIAFIPIKTTLKRDLDKYEEQKERNRENGKKGGRPKKTEENPKNPVGYLENPPKAKKAVSDSDSVSDSVSVRESKEERRERVKAEFKNSLLPFLDKYGKEMLKAFFDYWSEHGPNDAKMRFEKEKSYDISKRLATWAKRERAFNPSAEPQRKKNRLEI